MRRKSTDNAFTLVELLVVIAIIALLISFLLPALNRARQSASKVACQSGLHQIFTFATMYANDYRDFYPPYSFSNGALASGYSLTAPANSWWLLDQYSRLKYDSAGTVGTPGKLDYDQWGPTSNNIYFCGEFRARHVRGTAPIAFGYAVNPNYTGGWRPWATPMFFDGVRRTRIPHSSYTIFMREMPLPSYDNNLAGPDVWPRNLTTHAYSFAAANFSIIHMGGQNILYFDGHVRYFHFPDSVEGQIVEGFNSENYSIVFPGFW